MSALLKMFKKEDPVPGPIVIPPPKPILVSVQNQTKISRFNTVKWIQSILAHLQMLWEGLLVIWELLGVAFFFILTKQELPIIKTNSLVQMSLFVGAVSSLVLAWGAVGYGLGVKVFLSVQIVRALIFLGSPINAKES